MRRTAQLLAGIVLMSGCGREPTTIEITSGVQPRTTASLAAEAAENSELEVLRRETAPLQKFERAKAAGYSLKLTDCMEMPGVGGMGFHYARSALIDGRVSVAAPEVLLFEHTRSGKLELVGVEYIIPYSIRSRDADPPTLFGQHFRQNDVFQLWGLHVWVWKRNPSGLFADWNPRVTCEHAIGVSMTAHRG